MSLFSEMKMFCNCCGDPMMTNFNGMMGGRVCSTECIAEFRHRETLAIMGKEYYPHPEITTDWENRNGHD